MWKAGGEGGDGVAGDFGQNECQLGSFSSLRSTRLSEKSNRRSWTRSARPSSCKGPIQTIQLQTSRSELPRVILHLLGRKQASPMQKPGKEGKTRIIGF